MNAPESRYDWTDANQRYLVVELARLKARLEGRNEVQPASLDLQRARAALPAPTAIDQLAERFGLNSFERDLLLLSAGVELDSELAAQCAKAQGQPQRTYPSFGLALAALEDPHWSALTPARPLRRWRLIEMEEREGWSTARLRIDERVLHYLAGVNYLDTRLQPLLRVRPPAETMADSQARVARLALAAFEPGESWPTVQTGGRRCLGSAGRRGAGRNGGGPATLCAPGRGYCGGGSRTRSIGRTLATGGGVVGQRAADRLRQG